MTREEPYDKVLRAEFYLKGLKDMKEAAFLQYRLMLLKPILRAHVDFKQKSMELIYTDPNFTKDILKEIEPIKAMLSSRESVDYEDVVDESYHKK